MEEDYNWSLILKFSVPVSVIVGIVFYISISNFWKWIILLIGLVAAGALVYMNDKRKSNVFTAIAIVLLTTLVMALFKSF